MIVIQLDGSNRSVRSCDSIEHVTNLSLATQEVKKYYNHITHVYLD